MLRSNLGALLFIRSRLNPLPVLRSLLHSHKFPTVDGSIRLLREQGHDLFIELGPGKVLAGFMSRIDKEARIISIEDAASLEAAIAKFS